MDLVLTVISDPSGTNMLNHTKVISGDGGSLGRSEKNNWVLPDPDRVVSSVHATIQFRDGHFQLNDLSTNGTYVNDATDPLGNDKQYQLNDGDVITAGDYKLKVAIKRPQPIPHSGLPQGIEAVDFLDNADKTTFGASASAQQQKSQDVKELDRWLDQSAEKPVRAETWGYLNEKSDVASKPTQFGNTVDPLHASESPVSKSNKLDPISQFGQLNPTPSNANGWDDDDDWWKSGSEPDHAPSTSHAVPEPRIQQPALTAPAPVAQPPVERPATAPADPFSASRAALGQPLVAADEVTENSFSTPQQLAPTDPTQPPTPVTTMANDAAMAAPAAAQKSADAAALAVALGLSGLQSQRLQQLVPETAEILEETVSRLIDLLRARTTIKNELRVERTMIQTIDNNPLKFSANYQDAIKAMFAAETNAFMQPIEAISDSFDDLSDHQVAVLSGMRAAYNAMFKHFSPHNVERRLNPSGSLLISKSAKAWDSYCDYYKVLSRDSEASYNNLFGDDFAAGYEKQLAELKNARAASKKRKR